MAVATKPPMAMTFSNTDVEKNKNVIGKIAQVLSRADGAMLGKDIAQESGIGQSRSDVNRWLYFMKEKNKVEQVDNNRWRLKGKISPSDIDSHSIEMAKKKPSKKMKESAKKSPSKEQGGYNETDTVPTAVPRPGPTTSLASDYKNEHDNTLSEEIHDAINLSLKSVGMLLIANVTGTAFRVGSKYAMTNWHVIRNHVEHLKNGQTVFHNLERINAFINFSADPRLPIKQTFYISSIVPYFDDQLDIAVVELKTDNSINLPPALPLCTEHEECKNVKKLNVLGFGHPDSYKKTEEFATVIPPGSDRVMDAHRWVQQNEETLNRQCSDRGIYLDSFTWDYEGWDDDKNVAIDLFKEKGSSGSPAMLTADASNVKVMAVVYRGLPDCFWELPSSLRLAFPTYCRIELAVKMSHIYVSMLNKNPTLTKDVFQGDEVDMEL